MKNFAGRAMWAAGWPARAILLALIRGYRLSLGRVMGGRCRFYPSCSEYAEAATAGCGALRGTALAVWRILRCSPLSAGGVDHPPRSRHPKAEAPTGSAPSLRMTPSYMGERSEALL